MDFERIGLVQGHLATHRSVYSKAPRGRRLRAGEAEAAATFLSLRQEEQEALAALLRGNGLELRTFQDDFPGIPRGGMACLALRAPDAPPGAMLSAEPVWKALALTVGEARPITLYWFGFLWLLLLSLLYEREGRPLSSVSDYVSAVVSSDDLDARVTEELEALRREGLGGEGGNAPVAEALLAGGRRRETSDADRKKRVSGFLEVLVAAGLLEPWDEAEGDRSYRQTLLCAVQLDELYGAGLIHLAEPHGLVAAVEDLLVARDVAVTGPDAPGAKAPDDPDPTRPGVPR